MTKFYVNLLCKPQFIVCQPSVNFYSLEKAERLCSLLFVIFYARSKIFRFIDVIKDTPWQLEVYSGTNAARSYWYFSYGETGLNIKVIVDDRILWPSPYQSGTGYKDNIEFILGAKTTATGYETDKTLKFLVAYDGGNYVQVASSATAWANKSLAKSDYTVNVSTKSLENKQGYNGYEVNMFVSYAALGLTKANAVGNITTCIAMRNTNGLLINELMRASISGVLFFY